MKRFMFVLLAVVTMAMFIGCSDASVVRTNLETAEQNFQVYRRVVFYNGITDKHYLGLSDNVTYFSEALRPNDVSTKRYKVVFKPSVIIPTIEVK